MTSWPPFGLAFATSRSCRVTSCTTSLRLCTSPLGKGTYSSASKSYSVAYASDALHVHPHRVVRALHRRQHVRREVDRERRLHRAQQRRHPLLMALRRQTLHEEHELRILAIRDRGALAHRPALHDVHHVQEAVLLHDLLDGRQRLRHAAVEAPRRNLRVELLVEVLVLLDLLCRRASALRGARAAALRRLLLVPRRRRRRGARGLRGPRPGHAERTALHLRLLLLLELLQRHHVVAHERLLV